MTEGAPAVGSANGRPHEIELKYRVEVPAAAERLLRADRIGEFAGGLQSMRTTQMEDRYVDTIDGALARAGFAVRLRQTGAGTIVSVKSTARGDGPGGASRREELEGPADRVAGAADWPASDARALVLEHAGDAPLIELVTVRQLRRRRIMKAPDARVELSLDEVDVVARGRVIDRFVEFEAELLKGDEAALAAIAVAFDDAEGMRRSPTSKFEAAMTAVRGEDDGDGRGPVREPVPVMVDGAATDHDETPGPDEEAAPGPVPDETIIEAEDQAITTESGTTPRSEPEPGRDEATVEAGSDDGPAPLSVGKTPGVAADDHVAEAGRKVLRFHLARMLDYEAGTRTGTNIEDLHKMRVATRRQRAAWRVFGEAFRPRRTKRYRNGLREIASRLGAVRDLDVLIEEADAYRADFPVAEQRSLEPLVGAWRTYREDARVLLLRELDSDGYQRWVDDYRDFVRTEGALVRPVGPVEPHRVRDTAPSSIWAAFEQVRGYEAVLRWADVETLHDLRIAAKWLRYSLEFVREALGPESAPLIARVTALQDHLGMLHDADVAAHMARTLLVDRAGELSNVESAAIGRYLVDRERQVARLHRTIGNPWRGVAGAPFRRSLGRVVAGV